MQVPETPVANAGTEQVELKAHIKDALNACRKFGAYEVRKAAIRQIDGDSCALATVGLKDQYLYGHLYDISDTAFLQMTDNEKFLESCLNYGVESVNNE